VDELDRPELMRDLALADHGIRRGGGILAAGLLLMLGGFVAAGALDYVLFIIAGFIGMFFSVVGGLIALDSVRESQQARRSLRELDRMRALPEARVIR
jgi:hypothetical protein